MSDDDKVEVFVCCVYMCGFELIDECVCFLLMWLSCDMCVLFDVLDKFDYVLMVV